MGNSDVGPLIKLINEKLKLRANNEFKKYNLTIMQSRVFHYLSDNGGVATQKDIEKYLNVSHPTVKGIISRMENNGFVKCTKSDDNKNKNVSLTKKAFNLEIEMRNNMRACEKFLLEPLNKEETKIFKNLLEKISDHIEKNEI